MDPELKSDAWLRLDSGPGAPAFNMALDEALLESAVRRGRPVLRFYSWRESAATFGYSQKFADIEKLTLLRPLIRRPTGGGLVPHDEDWTYTLVFPPDHWWHALRATESYRRIHEWIREALTRMEIPSDLSPVCSQDPPSRCFARVERYDLLWQERKIAGAAQRRNRLGWLIQGSVQPPAAGLRRAEWRKAMCEAAQSAWGVRWNNFKPEQSLTDRARELERTKYSLKTYNEKR